MTGETDLHSLIVSLQPELHEGTFVFATVNPGDDIPVALRPLMTFREAEGLTLIVRQDEAREAGLAAEFPCRWITLNVHSSLSAVGFLAAITDRLAGAGISVNAVSAVHHDHLFVPEEQASEAMEILATMEAGRKSG